MAIGTIRRLVADKGFGFIADEAGAEYFFHRSALRGLAFEQLRQGQRVAFTPEVQRIHLDGIVDRLTSVVEGRRSEAGDKGCPCDMCDAAMLEIAKHLSPGNENVRTGDIVASIRDLAQAKLSAMGLLEELYATIRTVRDGLLIEARGKGAVYASGLLACADRLTAMLRE